MAGTTRLKTHVADVGFQQRPGGSDAGVVDQHRDARVALEQHLDLRQVDRVEQVRGDGFDRTAGARGDVLRERAQPVCAARHEDEVVAGTGEPIGVDRADAGGRAGDQRGARVEVRVHGENWFDDLGDKFPLPFSLLGANVNWTLATWLELIGSVALLLGVGTRFFAAALWVLTIVAIYAVHWPSDWSSFGELWQGYAITNQGFGNFKLPVIYLAMLLPLMFGGAGRLSFDHLVARMRTGYDRFEVGDLDVDLVQVQGIYRF